jgi:N-acetylmuramoyl-L-alanine amidase
MTIRIGIDDGHGMETAGKRTPSIAELGGRVIRENEFNRAVARKLNEALKRCGFYTMYTADGDTDVPLSTRVARANDANLHVLVSIHYNANTGSFSTNTASGVETLAGSSSTSKAIAHAVQSELVKGTSQKDRGVKDGSWLYLNRTECPMILIEGGFMDDKREAMLMINADFIAETAEDITRGLCKHFGVTYKAPATSSPEPAPELKGIGTCDVLQDCNFHKEATSNSEILRELKQGDHYNVYSITDGWVALGGGFAHESFLKIAFHSHIVEAGDSLWSISQKYNTTVDAIKKLNGLTSDVIQVGQKLRVK